MADVLYRVSWKTGSISVHASNEKRAVEIAAEYLRVPDAKRLSAHPVPEMQEVATSGDYSHD